MLVFAGADAADDDVAEADAADDDAADADAADEDAAVVEAADDDVAEADTAAADAASPRGCLAPGGREPPLLGNLSLWIVCYPVCVLG